MAKIKNMMMPKGKMAEPDVDDIIGGSDGDQDNPAKLDLKTMLSKKRPRKPRKM